MRSSIVALAKRQHLLASEVLASTQRLKEFQQTTQAAPETSGDIFFQQLPPALRQFFEKYPPAPYRQYSETPTSTHAEDANPFLPNRHPVTNSWHDPKYSMRRQSDLYKMAYRYGIAHLLPKIGNNKKFYEEKYATKKPVDGSLRFKLTKGERIAPMRQQEVDTAVAAADATIAKARGAGYRRRIEKKSQVKGSFV